MRRVTLLQNVRKNFFGGAGLGFSLKGSYVTLDVMTKMAGLCSLLSATSIDSVRSPLLLDPNPMKQTENLLVPAEAQKDTVWGPV